MHHGSYCADAQILSRESISAEAAMTKLQSRRVKVRDLGWATQGSIFVSHLDDNDLVCL